MLLIDGIGPFFRDDRRPRINWSKIPFETLEPDGRFDPARFGRAADDFALFCERVAAEGFNAVSLDDLAHLTDDPAYPDDLRRKLDAYRAGYRRLFASASASGLAVYLTTDVMYAPVAAWPTQRARVPVADPADRLTHACDTLFREHPEVAGVIFRIGECDAGDVRGDFRSRLVIRTPGQAHRLLRTLLPLFEHHERNLVFRTWTVGAHPIGDLIWNRRTYDRVFDGLDSRRLIVSMKYGETDFFRFLPLNPLFFRGPHAKLVELQARREYEGFGEYPSFVGWDYEPYLRRLAADANLAGVWVWCQTGGWSGFRRRTFLDPGGIWNEINAVVTLRLATDQKGIIRTVRDYARERFGAGHEDRLAQLLFLSSQVVRYGLYIEECARFKRFFRRLRVPPLLHVFWDRILINHPMRKLLRCWVRDPQTARRQAHQALKRIRTMQTLAREIGLPADDFDFQYDTFEILAAARDYYFDEFGPPIVRRLEILKTAYEQRYAGRPRYSVCLDFRVFRLHRDTMRRLIAILMRSRRGYRMTDRVILIRLLSLLSPLVSLFARRAAARLADEAMGIDTVLTD